MRYLRAVIFFSSCLFNRIGWSNAPPPLSHFPNDVILWFLRPQGFLIYKMKYKKKKKNEPTQLRKRWRICRPTGKKMSDELTRRRGFSSSAVVVVVGLRLYTVYILLHRILVIRKWGRRFSFFSVSALTPARAALL
jgi:hypothetical protein